MSVLPQPGRSRSLLYTAQGGSQRGAYEKAYIDPGFQGAEQNMVEWDDHCPTRIMTLSDGAEL